MGKKKRPGVFLTSQKRKKGGKNPPWKESRKKREIKTLYPLTFGTQLKTLIFPLKKEEFKENGNFCPKIPVSPSANFPLKKGNFQILNSTPQKES